jgi:hypothetical protein
MAPLKKEPAIGDGSQSREKRQGKSIRGSVVCRNSHTERETLLVHSLAIATPGCDRHFSSGLI